MAKGSGGTRKSHPKETLSTEKINAVLKRRQGDAKAMTQDVYVLNVQDIQDNADVSSIAEKQSQF